MSGKIQWNPGVAKRLYFPSCSMRPRWMGRTIRMPKMNTTSATINMIPTTFIVPPFLLDALLFCPVPIEEITNENDRNGDQKKRNGLIGDLDCNLFDNRCHVRIARDIKKELINRPDPLIKRQLADRGN